MIDDINTAAEIALQSMETAEMFCGSYDAEEYQEKAKSWVEIL